MIIAEAKSYQGKAALKLPAWLAMIFGFNLKIFNSLKCFIDKVFLCEKRNHPPLQHAR